MNILKSILTQQGLHIRSLSCAHLKNQTAAQAEGPLPLGANGTVKFKSILSPVQGLMRFIILHRGLQGRNIRSGDIGRITGDHIKIP